MCVAERRAGRTKIFQFGSPTESQNTDETPPDFPTDNVIIKTPQGSMAATVTQRSRPVDLSVGLDGFPRAFVASLKVLFDILDEDADGLVHIAEIEKRWASEGGPTGLPYGVLHGLRKVTPKDGRLSFKQFCGGLRRTLDSDRGLVGGLGGGRGGGGRAREDRQPNTATVRPNNAVRPMTVRTKSAPQLPRHQSTGNGRARSLSSTAKAAASEPPTSDWEAAVQRARHTEDKIQGGRYRVRDDPPPPAAGRRSAPGDLNANDPSRPRLQSDHQQQIRHHQRAQRRSEGDYVRYPPPPPFSAPPPVAGRPTTVASKPEKVVAVKSMVDSHKGQANTNPVSRPDKSNNSKPDRAAQPPVHDHPRSHGSKPADNQVVSERHSPTQPLKPPKELPKNPSKRSDPRRHTVTNGIDYNLLKRMKQLEQERDVLLQGMEMAERSKDWYQRQLAYVRQRQPGYSGNSQFTHGEDSPASGHQDRLAYRMSRVLDINKQLTHLMENPEKDFPDHMNLAISSMQPGSQPPLKLRPGSTSSSSIGNGSSSNSNLVAQLREQNRLLTMEVSQKSELITQLEKDKAALIRQLFEARGKKTINNNNMELPNNTTFL